MVASSPARTADLFVTWVLLLMAPLSVVLVLSLTENVIWTFLAYHIGVCLLVPFGTNAARNVSLRDHFGELGVTRSGGRRGLGIGLVLALAGGLAIVLALQFFSITLLSGTDIPTLIERWGIAPTGVVFLGIYMVLVNSTTEELYWRGYLQHRMRTWRNRWVAWGVTNLAFASYHFHTVQALTGSAALGAMVMVGIFATGVLWSWTRHEYGSTWPAILAHMGATIGYMVGYVAFLA